MIIAAILAGGKGTRLGGEKPKQLLPLGDKPVIQWSVDTFHSNDLIDEILIVSEKFSIETMREIFNEKKYPKIKAIIEGGRERVESSAKAVFFKEYNPDDIILIHDAARPFISSEIIQRLIDTVKNSDAAGVYIPATDTIAIARGETIESIPDRKTIFYAQTPQAFKYHIILEAHKNYLLNKMYGITDDVSLVNTAGYDAKIVNGSELNFKITTERDYIIADLMVKNKMI